MELKYQDTLDEFAAQVRKYYPYARIWAFGSRVHGNATWESDLNVCVVLEEITPEDRTRISDIAWEIGLLRDVVMTTIVFTRHQFEIGPLSVSPLVREIRGRGVAA